MWFKMGELHIARCWFNSSQLMAISFGHRQSLTRDWLMDFTCKCQTKAAATRRSPLQIVQQRLMLQLLHLLQPQLRPQRWRCPWLGNWDPMNGRNFWRPTGSCSHRQVGDGQIRIRPFQWSKPKNHSQIFFLCTCGAGQVALRERELQVFNWRSQADSNTLKAQEPPVSVRVFTCFYHLPCVVANISTLHESSQQLARGVAW